MEQDNSPTEYSFLSSVTASPFDDPFQGAAELRDEDNEPGLLTQVEKHSQTQEMPERLNLKELFDSLQVSSADNGAANLISSNCNAAVQTTSTVARLIEKYGGLTECNEQTKKSCDGDIATIQEQEKLRKDEQPATSVEMEDEDEIQKVYKTSNSPVQRPNEPVSGISLREGGVEAIPWEVRLESFNANREGTEEGEGVGKLKRIAQSQAAEAHERVKSLSLYSGSDQHSKPRSRSDTRGRRWQTRQPSALSKSWIGKVARQQANNVKRQVGTVRNMISADDY